MRGVHERNGWIEFVDEETQDLEVMDVEVGVRSITEDGHVEIILSDPENVSNEYGSIYVNAEEGSEYSPKYDNAADELAEKIKNVANR